jgi:hypothetical protein
VAQRTGRAVARIGHGFVAALACGGVPGLERGLGHEDFAAHFEDGGNRESGIGSRNRRGSHCVALDCALIDSRLPIPDSPLLPQPQRNRLHRAQVRGHVLAAGAVSAGGTTHEAAVFVAQADGQAVELGFGGKRSIRVAGFLRDAVDESLHLVVAEGVGQRQHGHRVAHGGELAGRRVAHALRGRIRIGEFGVLGLQRLEFAEQAVVLGVRDVRFVEHVIAMVRVVDAATQGFDAGGGGCRHRGILSPSPGGVRAGVLRAIGSRLSERPARCAGPGRGAGVGVRVRRSPSASSFWLHRGLHAYIARREPSRDRI